MYFQQSYYSSYSPLESEQMSQWDGTDKEIMSVFNTLERGVPFTSPAFRQAMANVLGQLQVTSRALAVGCGLSSEFRYIPDVWELPELHIVHADYLTPLSYHLYSALGASELLAAGQGRTSHFPLLVGCMRSIIRLWQTFPGAIANLRRAVGTRYASAVDQAEMTLKQMVPPTQQALAISQSAVDPVTWNAAFRAAEIAYAVREKVAKSIGQEAY